MSARARWRLAAPLALLAGLAGADQPPAAREPLRVPSPDVRVLLREGPEGLRVGGGGGPQVRVEAGASGVTVAGRNAGPVWRLAWQPYV